MCGKGGPGLCASGATLRCGSACQQQADGWLHRLATSYLASRVVFMSVIESCEHNACLVHTVHSRGALLPARRQSERIQQQPVEELAEMSVQPPSPSKIKSGPWLSGTYKLPKTVGRDAVAGIGMQNWYADKAIITEHAGQQSPGLQDGGWQGQQPAGGARGLCSCVCAAQQTARHGLWQVKVSMRAVDSCSQSHAVAVWRTAQRGTFCTKLWSTCPLALETLFSMLLAALHLFRAGLLSPCYLDSLSRCCCLLPILDRARSSAARSCAARWSA